MDKDRIEGTAKQAKGAVKEAVGNLASKVTGEPSQMEAEGVVEKNTGKAQAAAGKVKDGVRDAVK